MGIKGWSMGMFFLLVLGAGFSLAAEKEKVAVSASFGAFNQYVFRGYKLSSNSMVLQPSLGAAYRGFSASFWGNIDTDEHATQSFSPDRPGEKSFNETDLTLSYTHNFGKVGITGGYIYYGTKYAAETEELYASVTYDTYGSPTLTIYRDITSYPGTYVNLSLAQSWKIFKEVTLDFGGSAGYFSGDSGYWKTYESSTGGYTGKKYQAFHDGMIKVGITVPSGKNLAIQPAVQYWFPLSGEAKRKVDGNSYNPNGHLDDVWVAGIQLKFPH